MFAAYSFLLALFISTALVPLLIKVAGPLGMLDAPSTRKIHSEPVPRIGGIAILAGVLAPVLWWFPNRADIQAYLMAALLIGIFGVWDDRKSLSYRVKFLGQIIAACILVFVGDVVFWRVPFVDHVLLPEWIAIPFTIILVVGITNAVNLSDGLDGLAGGTSIIAVSSFGFLAYTSGDRTLAALGLAVMGSTMGFLRFNTHPARVFMGDTGSQFLGLSAVALGIMVCETPEAICSPLVPLLVLGVPILDTLAVIVQRMLDGRSPFSPDRLHIHHKLLDKGFDQYEAVVLIYAVQLLLATLAIWLAFTSDLVLAAIYLTFVVLIVGALRIARLLQWRDLGWHDRRSLVSATVKYSRAYQLLTKWPVAALDVMVPLILVVGAASADNVGFDFGIVSAVLLGLMAAGLVWQGFGAESLRRVVAFALAAFIAWLLESSSYFSAHCIQCLHLYFAAVALFVAMVVRFSTVSFKANTMDYLVVGIVFLVPSLPIYGYDQTLIGLVAIKIVILFYAIEVLLMHSCRRVTPLNIGVLGALGILVAKGLFS